MILQASKETSALGPRTTQGGRFNGLARSAIGPAFTPGSAVARPLRRPFQGPSRTAASAILALAGQSEFFELPSMIGRLQSQGRTK